MDSTCTRGQPPETIVVRGVGALDGSQELGGDALAGGLNGEIVAVITIRDGLVVANPLRSTAAVVDPAEEMPGYAPGAGVRWR